MTGYVAEIVARLGLAEHPEGGYFRETYRSTLSVETKAGPRSLCTAIQFLVTSGRPSRFHRLSSDEVWVHQGGAAVELVTLPREADGQAQWALLGTGEESQLQALVPAGVWQAARVPGGAGEDEPWSLVACIVTPGFDYADFELGRRGELVAAFPSQRQLIESLT